MLMKSHMIFIMIQVLITTFPVSKEGGTWFFPYGHLNKVFENTLTIQWSAVITHPLFAIHRISLILCSTL